MNAINPNFEVKITILWSESSEVRDGVTFYSFEACDDYLRVAANHSPKNGAYDKTKFRVEDGMTEDGDDVYEGRFDMMHPSVYAHRDGVEFGVRAHMRSFIADVLQTTDAGPQKVYGTDTKEGVAGWLRWYGTANLAR